MEMTFYWVGGATFILSIGNLNIACDPVLCKKGTVQDYTWFKSVRLEQPVYDEKTFNNIDIWMITHNHEDHLDNIGLSNINKESTVVSNKNSSKTIKDKGIKDVSVLNWHQSRKFAIKGYEIEIEAIPAIHGVNPLSALFAGKGNGYYLTVTKGNEKVKIYITGDTVYKNKIIKSLHNREIDLLIANLGAASKGSWVMTLTLNAKMLQKLITNTQPKTVIPVHFGTFSHYREQKEEIVKLEDKRIKFVSVGDSITIK